MLHLINSFSPNQHKAFISSYVKICKQLSEKIYVSKIFCAFLAVLIVHPTLCSHFFSKARFLIDCSYHWRHLVQLLSRDHGNPTNITNGEEEAVRS